MKRPVQFVAALVPLLVAACGADPQVVVQASLEASGAPIADLPVRLLPYDRQAILDSLARASEVPEPVIPQDLIQQLKTLDAQEQQARTRGDTALARVSQLRRSLNARADTVRAVREAWASKAYAGFQKAVEAKLDAAGASEMADTTDASGRVVFKASEGPWWVSSRYTLPYSELNWNVPIQVTTDSTRVPLTRANARERPFL